MSFTLKAKTVNRKSQSRTGDYALTGRTRRLNPPNLKFLLVGTLPKTLNPTPQPPTPKPYTLILKL